MPLVYIHSAMVHWNLFVQMRNSGDFEDIQVIVVYKFPSCSFNDYKNSVEMNLKSLIDKSKTLLIIGDFNFDLVLGNTDFLNYMI